MSSDRGSSLTGAHGLLRGQRTKSYGSLVTSSLSPVRQKRIEHEVQPGETLQGLSLKYGVSLGSIQDMLGNAILPSLWTKFGEGPFVFQHNCAPVHKASSIKAWLEISIEEQSPDLNPIQHLRDVLERRLRPRPFRLTAVNGLINSVQNEHKFPTKTPKLCKNTSKKNGSCYSCKGMEQIKRANRLYTNDSIFLKKFLFIPVLTESLTFGNENELFQEVSAQEESNSHHQVPTGNGQTDFGSQEVTSDLSPTEYLKRMDSLINQSKQAAVKSCQEGDQQFSSMEQLHHSNQGTSASFSQGQHAVLGAVPLTITKRTKKLRDREDEIFQL